MKYEMSEDLIFEARFSAGQWTGRLRRDEAQAGVPEIGVFLSGKDLGDVTVSADDDYWNLEFAFPLDLLGNGVSTFVFVDRRTSEALGRFCFIAGKAAELDVLAQLDALQSELTQLKAAFRREARRNRSEQ